MDDLNDFLQLRSIQLLNCLAEILLLLKGQTIVVCNGFLPLALVARRRSIWVISTSLDEDATGATLSRFLSFFWFPLRRLALERGDAPLHSLDLALHLSNCA